MEQVFINCARTGVNSSQLESKIIKGYLAKNEEYKHIASLQLNGSHICGSGLFKKRFLLTTGECAWLIAHGVRQRNEKATAVFGALDLKDGQRIDIFKVAYLDGIKFSETTHKKNNYEIGVIMLADTIDYTRVRILDLLEEPLDIRIQRSGAVLCGWGAVTKIEPLNFHFKYSKYSEKLHCMSLNLRGDTTCRTISRTKFDYRRKVMCGQAIESEQSIHLGDLGSTLTEYIDEHSGNYIIGVTIRGSIGKSGILLHFVRINYVLDTIRDLVEKLQNDAAAENSNSCQGDIEIKPSKRHKTSQKEEE